MIPKRILLERKDGTLFQRIRPVFQGCVLVKTACPNDIHKQAKQLSFYACSEPLLVPQKEMNVLLKLLGDGDTIGFSNVIIKGDTLEVKDGPLKELSEIIMKCNHRKKRVKVSLSFLGETINVDLGAHIHRMTS